MSELKRPRKKRRKQGSQDNGVSADVDAFRFYRVAMDLPLAPVHASDPRKGIQEALDRFLTKFIPSLGFVLLTVNFESLTLLPVARLLDPTANMVCKVNFEGLGWRPAMGSTLRGRLMHSTRSHVSLILHNAFNASISSSHIPSDAYHWDPYMPNPHAGPETAMEDFYARKWREADEEQARFNGKTGLETEVRDLELESVEPEGEIGCWVHTATGLPMGDGQGFVAFRVIGLTMVNSTIAVEGSLLEDPFAKPLTAESLPRLPTPPLETIQEARTGDPDAAVHTQVAPEETMAAAELSTAKKDKKKKRTSTLEVALPPTDPQGKPVKKKRKKPEADATPAAVELAEVEAPSQPPKKRKKKRGPRPTAPMVL